TRTFQDQPRPQKIKYEDEYEYEYESNLIPTLIRVCSWFINRPSLPSRARVTNHCALPLLCVLRYMQVLSQSQTDSEQH
ncbi:MAG: hypothetical protein ACKOEO_19375, partial [Planctomycetaceae bacterium]